MKSLYAISFVFIAVSSVFAGSLDEITELFKQRENDFRIGGIPVHRVLEVDPLPAQSPTQVVNICLRFSEELALSTRSMDAESIRDFKRSFWNEIRLMSLSLFHPLCINVMAECADVLTASEIVEYVDNLPHLFATNHRLLERVNDFSLFAPDHVQSVFESPLGSGLNLSRVPNLLRTLSPASLVRLMEMTDWDLEEWEMRTLYEARGGNLQNLLDIFGDHINGFIFLGRYPWLISELLTGNHFVEPAIDRLIRLVEAKSFAKEQVFFAIIHAVINLESFVAMHLTNESLGIVISSELFNEALKRVLLDKKRLQELIKTEYENDFEFLSLASSPLTKITRESVERLNELVESTYTCDIVSGGLSQSWSRIVDSHLGIANFFTSGSVARQFLSMIVSSFPESTEEQINRIVDIFYRNRLTLLHKESIFALKMTWPESESVKELEQAILINPEIVSTATLQRTTKLIKTLLTDAIASRNEFIKTRESDLQTHISAWISFQIKLQAAGAKIRKYDHVYFSTVILPFLLEDEVIAKIIEEYPNIVIPRESVLYLVRNEGDRGILDRIIYGLDDYKMFTGADFQALQMDFSKVRRGLHTIPPIQLISYLKSKNGMINDPITFIGSLSVKHVWNVESFRKYLIPYMRLPMIIEYPALKPFFGLVYSLQGTGTLWDVIKWTINCEILYQETLMMGIDEKEAALEFLFNYESIYRKSVVKSLNASDAESNAVLKAIESIPLSQDRLNLFLNFESRIALMAKTLFPSYSAKSAQSKLQKSLQNFKILIKKLAPSDQEREFWLFLLSICAGEWESLRANELENERIPLYYRILLKRRLEKI